MWCTYIAPKVHVYCVCIILYRVTSLLTYLFPRIFYFKIVCFFFFISCIYFLGTAFFDFFRFLPADPEQLLLLNNEMEFSTPPLGRFCFSCNGCGCFGDANGYLIGCCLSITLAWPHERFTLPLNCDRLVGEDGDDVATPSAAEVAWVATCWTPFSIQPW